MKKEKAYVMVLAGLLAVVGLTIVIKTGADRMGKAENVREVILQNTTFTESSRELLNPNRGFYHMHGFVIKDEEIDYREDIARRFCWDQNTTLTLVQINLCRYTDREISEEGLRNVERLLETLSRTERQIILRFLYDWDGKNLETEPESIETILTHMSQLEPALRKYKDSIFVVQGIFVGNVGEMHHSKYLEEEDVRTLANKLAEVTDEETFLAVRTPAYWRRTTGIAYPEEVEREDGTLACRMGLYNDGMLGSVYDTGTYGDGTLEKDGPYVNWRREDELAFQDILCRLVPLGGEVIIENPYNDVENAIEDLAATHVTYLNRDHDGSVLEKWEKSTISEEGCYNGMDALTYIERHLGYRLVLREAESAYEQKDNMLTVKISVQNTGFAPVYKKADIRISLYHEQSGTLWSFPVEQDIRELAGGAQSEELLFLEAEVPAAGMQEGEWGIYLDLRDHASDQRILFGNEEEPGKYGYQVGTLKLGPVESALRSKEG